MLPAPYDDPSLPHKYLQDPPGSGSDTLAYPTQEVLGLFAEEDPISAVGKAGEVYLVVFEREIIDYERLGYVQHPAIMSLAASYRVRDIMMWEDLLLFSLERIE